MVLQKILNDYYICKNYTSCKDCLYDGKIKRNCSKEMCIVQTVIKGPISKKQVLMLKLNNWKEREMINFLNQESFKVLTKKIELGGECKEIIDLELSEFKIEKNSELAKSKNLTLLIVELEKIRETVLKKNNQFEHYKIEYLENNKIKIKIGKTEEILNINIYKEENQNG